MKKILFILIFQTLVYSQTGIITSKGFQGIGIWTTINTALSNSENSSYDIHLEYYSHIGIELSAGILQEKGAPRPWNHVGLAYHVKTLFMNLKLYYSKNLYDITNFEEGEITFENYNLTFYKTGKLNPFVKLTGFSGYKDFDHKTVIDFISIGGLGRITRNLTLSGSLKFPIDGAIDINNGSIEASIGYVY